MRPLSAEAPYPATKNRAVEAVWSRRTAREETLLKLQKQRHAQALNQRLLAAQERSQMQKSASVNSLHEAGRARDASIARANQLREEQAMRKQLQAAGAAAARERERKAKVKRASMEKTRMVEEVARYNREEEMKRQQMLEKVASQEAEERHQLASQILQADAAGRARQRDIAVRKSEVIAERATQLQGQLQRVQSAKTLREAVAMERARTDAHYRATAREDRVAKAKVTKEEERRQYARRNAEEEARRVQALAQVHQREATSRVHLARQIAMAAEGGRQRILQVAQERSREVAGRAVALRRQRDAAVEAKMKLEAERERQVQALGAERERERRARAMRAQELKESERLYYVQRNALEEARYDQRSLQSFERAAAELTRPQSAQTLLLTQSGSAGSLNLARTQSVDWLLTER